MVESARVSAPMSGGRGWPFGMPDEAEVAAHGYVMEEYLATGDARRYDLAAEASASRDGRWLTVPGERAPYTTRFVVIRPADAGSFNGVVVVHWQNVTAGLDLGAPHGREIWRGYAWVGVTAQRVALTGGRGQPGLPAWDSARYGTLEHPGDPWSFDIYAQVAHAVGPDRSGNGVDPMGGLTVDTVVAKGSSQSAARLGSYINGVHQHHELIDAFLPVVHWGVCFPPDESLPTITANGDIVGDRQIRDDQGVPVLVVNSETEAWSVYPVRQPDSDGFRFWEVTGGCHGGSRLVDDTNRMLARDGIDLGALGADTGNRNTVDWSYVEDAAMRGLVEWARRGRVPASFDRIELAYGDPLDSVVRDELGVGRGGLRVPEVAVPLAAQRGVNTTPDMLLKLSGERRPFTTDEIADLYPDVSDYQKRYDRAADELVAQGAVLADDLDELTEHGRRLAEEAGLS